MTDETREKVKKRILRMVSALDDDELKLLYYLAASALRNQSRRKERKGGA